ncbi:ribbon-helix-helix domain-containing protein [uncultured Treponema sp.]|uniref:ribbon-helix-helix domain-containing protein n=1 Tax=uncultured Treponema sp. TaxID=162155 RepID=UPI0025EA2577|nr:ribbon-helix-helix domain-containing protein [uncultured Treponema sp.]
MKVVNNSSCMPQRPLSNSEETSRISISLPDEVYNVIKQIAVDKKVSIAWVIRDALSEYLSKKEKSNG